MTAKIISLDFELCSTLDLSDVGAYEWTKSKNTIPILAGFALDHEEPQFITLAPYCLREDDLLALRDLLRRGRRWG